MSAQTLIEKLESLRYSDSEIWESRNKALDEAIAVVRQHETERSVNAEMAFKAAWDALHSDPILANDHRNEFIGRNNSTKTAWLHVAVRAVIAAMGRASETGIGNHASMAHQQDHALTPPASDADRSEPASGLLSMHIGTEMLPDEVMLAISAGKARPEDYGMKQVYPAPASEAYRKVEEALRCADRFCASWHPSYATIGEALDVLPVLKPKPDAPTPKDAALQVAVEALTWLCVREVHYDTDVRAAPDLTSDAWARADAALAQIKAILEGRQP